MSELDGFGRHPFPRGGLRTAQLSPGLLTAGGPSITSSYLFPAGYFDGTDTPNQALIWSINVWAADLGAGSIDSPQAAGMQFATIPGRQYTASCYVNQSSPNNLYAAITDLSVFDGFNRITASGWGGDWTTVGTASDYNTVFAADGGHATHTLTSVNASRKTTISSSCWDASQVVAVATDALAAGAPIDVGVMLRYTDTSNYYRCVLGFNTDQTISLTVNKRVAGSGTDLSTATTSLTHVAGTYYLLRFEMPGDAVTFQARAWLAGTPEPTTWDVTVTDDCALNGAGALGCYSILEVGNTNTLPVVVSFANYAASAMAVLGTSINRPLEWSRLSVTFTATQPQHTLSPLTIPLANVASAAAIPLPGMVSCDNVQVEQAASASTFTTAGPVIYPVLRDFVERWPRVWSAKGFEGFTPAPCVDALAALTAITIGTEYHEAVLSLSPDYYWHLDDLSGTTLFVDTSGNHGPPLLYNDSKYGPGTVTTGTAIDLVGDPGGTGVTFSGGVAASKTGTGLQTGLDGTLPVAVGTNTAAWQLSVAFWATFPTTPNNLYTLFALSRGSTTIAGPAIWVNTDSIGNINLNVYYNTVSSGSSAAITGDGLPHLCILIVQLAAGTLSGSLVVDDGAAVASVSINTSAAYGTTTPNFACTVVELAGLFESSFSQTGYAATYSHLAIWNRTLNADERTYLYTVGLLGYDGDSTGAYIERHLALGGYLGAARLSDGQSTLQPATYTNSINLLTDIQNTTTAEQGTIWVAPDGVFVFEDRFDRFLRLTSTYTFGEDTASGELPYLGEIADLEFDYDPNFVYPDVQVTRTNAVTAVGGTLDLIDAARRRFFPRSYAADVDLQTDQQAQNMADWIFNTHRAPLLRVSVLTFDPASNPDLWPMVLSVEVGTRVTVVRRAKAANQGAGLTITGDYFVEQVSHSLSMEGTWQTQLWCSPIGDASSGSGVSFQPWILGDATYSALGETTILGW